MLEISVIDKTGKDVSKHQVSEKVFGLKVNKQVIYDALKWFQACQRRGTHSTLTRAEVSGGGKKPWKQKGTGRARVGSIRSPLWRHGGVIFGPKPRSYAYALPIKVRKLALAQALSQKAAESKIKLLESSVLSAAKTKEAKNLLKNAGISGKILVLLAKDGEGFEKAARNLRGVVVNTLSTLNIFDVLNCEWIVAEKEICRQIEEKLN
jgi:large subunit ribosomal protein L4